MPGNRCINNPFGYCHSQPQLEPEHTQEHTSGPESGFHYNYELSGRCINNWATCTQFSTWQKETASIQASN